MNAAVQTPEHEADLFDSPPPAAASEGAPFHDFVMSFTGKLLHHAEVRCNSRQEPVLCVELQSGAGRNNVRAEQVFPKDAHHQAVAIAASLRKGQTVTVATSVANVRVFMPGATVFIPQP